MRAKEYYAKYHDRIIAEASGDEAKVLHELMVEMSEETKDLIGRRNIKDVRALGAVIKESNDKWNALVRLFEKEHGASPLKVDGFKSFWLDRMPHLGMVMK